MADLLIRIRDKESSGDAETDALQFKRGDVIAVMPTPHPWSERERTNPDWRILRLPNIDAADLSALLRPENETQAVARPRLMRKRNAALDLDSVNWPQAIIDWLRDDTRAQPILSRNFTRAQAVAFIKAKTPRQARFTVFS